MVLRALGRPFFCVKGLLGVPKGRFAIVYAIAGFLRRLAAIGGFWMRLAAFGGHLGPHMPLRARVLNH